MKPTLTIFLVLILAGCGVELLATTAIQSDLQAEQLKAMKGQLGHAADQTAKVNIQRAIDTYAAEKGQYPASLAELAPAYIPSVPNRPDGQPYGYDPTTGKVLDRAAPVSAGPTSNDFQKMNQIRGAIDQYGQAVGFYPPSLAALAPTYLPAVPKTDSGQDFVFYSENGGLFHPAQLTQQAPIAQSGLPRPQPSRPAAGVGVGGTGPMGEVMTGIGIQNQLNSMGSSATNTAGGYARRSVGGATEQHNQQQEKAINDLGL
jgi:hypothetical protein